MSSFIISDNNNRVIRKEEFIAMLDTTGLMFEMPEGFRETVVRQNKDLWYSFAIKHKKEQYEIRYSVWSLKPALADYQKCLQDTNCKMIHPNSIYLGRIQSNVLNMTGGQMWNIDPFPVPSVKREFNADAGGSSFFEFKCEFGKGYKYGQMVYLHKNDVADVIITYMSNDKKVHTALMEKAFHALKFK
ncbi:MAG: hypothetical protein Fur0041_22060 [Bacteroidia bacterium]